MTVRGYLIVRGDGQMRMVSRTPRLALDEVAFPVSVAIPRMWGVVHTANPITVTLPEPPEVQVSVGDAVLAEAVPDGNR